MTVPEAISLALQRVALQRRTWVCVGGMCGFAAATALAAHVRIPLPFSPVPVTLQTFVVLLAGATLGARAGAGSQGLYLLLGACGAPIFAGGAGALSGVTAGYLLAFPLAAWIVGSLARRDSRLALALGLLLGTLVIYVLGVGWLTLGMGRSLGPALMLGAVPFLPGDAMKLAAAWVLSKPLRQGYERAAQV